MAADEACTPSISVLVPVYNVERYLRQCMDSLCAQTLHDLEIVCINDGSTDSSLALLQEYAARDPRIVLIDKANSGYGASMNRGLDIAQGDYIGILESDDFLDPGAFEAMYRATQEGSADVVKANFFFYWSTPQPHDELAPLIAEDMAGACDPLEQTKVFYLKPTIWSAIYRREFLEKNKIRFLETPGASYQDSSFNFKVWASAGKAVLLEEAFLHYRQDNEASSINSPGKVYCVCDEHAEMQRFLEERPDETKARLQGILVRMKFADYMWNYDRLDSRFKLEFLQRASEELDGDLTSGRLDLALFEPWAQADLMALIQSPEAYNQYRLKYAQPGKLNTFRRYFSLGGLPLIAKMAKDKLRRSGK